MDRMENVSASISWLLLVSPRLSFSLIIIYGLTYQKRYLKYPVEIIAKLD
jgi:hypothetical protein